MAENIHVVLDNLAAVRSLQPKRLSELSPGPTAQMAAARRIWARRTRAPHIPEGEVKVWWTPGHAGLEGNEKADRLAKLGAALNPSRPLPPTISYLRRELVVRDSCKWWKENAPSTYQDLAVQWQDKPKELELARQLLGKLVQHRTGHGDFSQYHRRWNHVDAELSCSCGREKPPSTSFSVKEFAGGLHQTRGFGRPGCRARSAGCWVRRKGLLAGRRSCVRTPFSTISAPTAGPPAPLSR